MSLTLVLTLLSVAGAALLLRLDRGDALSPPGPWRRVVIALAGALAVATGLCASLRAPQVEWNAVRLAHSADLLARFHFFESPHAGPILGTYYGPIGELFFAPATLIPDPAWAALVASWMSAAALLIPLVLWLAGSPRAAGWRVPLGLVFAMGVLTNGPLESVATLVHVDAPALAFALLACIAVVRPRVALTGRAVALSGVAAALAVGTKQTLVPVLVAVPLWLLWSGEWRAARTFVVAAAATVAAGALVLAAVDGLAAPLYHAIHLVLAFPVAHSPHEWRFAGEQLLQANMLPGIVILSRWWAAERRAERVAPASALFAVVALFEAPASVLGVLKYGGAINSLAPTTLFVWFAALAAVTDWKGTPTVRAATVTGVAIPLFAALLVPVAWTNFATCHPLSASPIRAAARYEARHPGAVWFAADPFIALHAGERPTHFDTAVHERLLAGEEIGDAQWRGFLPPAMRFACWAPGADLREPGAASARAAVAGNEPLTAVDDLPGWQCVPARAGRAPTH